MANENRWSAWGGAMITTVVAIALNPLMVLVGYYSSRMLAAPKLTVQYVTAIVENAPLALDKSVTSVPLLDDLRQFAPYQSFAAPTTYEPCDQEFTSGSLTIDCANHFRSLLQQNIQSIDFEENYIKRDREAIEQWDGKSDLSLTPLVLPNLSEPLEVTAHNDRRMAISLLRDDEKSIGEVRLELAGFREKLDSFATAPIRRTGKVSFKVGVLNSGDSDGVIFPGATLAFHDSELKLRTGIPGQATPVASPVYGGVNQFNVVRAHSFSEISFVVDEAGTPPGAQSEWRSLVTGGAQEKLTIELKSSAQPIAGTGWLPAPPPTQ